VHILIESGLVPVTFVVRLYCCPAEVVVVRKILEPVVALLFMVIFCNYLRQKYLKLSTNIKIKYIFVTFKDLT
jgi:hypothetical protein